MPKGSDGVFPSKKVEGQHPPRPLTWNEAFSSAFNRLVPQLEAKFKPEFIILHSADTREDGGLAHLRLTTRAYEKVTSVMHELAHKYSYGRLVAFGGAGYNLSNTSRCWSIDGKLTSYPTLDLPPSTLHDTTNESNRKNNRVTEDVLQTLSQIEMTIKG